jgi:hypothetical protein
LEYWEKIRDKKILVFLCTHYFLIPLFHHSNIPLFQVR